MSHLTTTYYSSEGHIVKVLWAHKEVLTFCILSNHISLKGVSYGLWFYNARETGFVILQKKYWKTLLFSIVLLNFVILQLLSSSHWTWILCDRLVQKSCALLCSGRKGHILSCLAQLSYWKVNIWPIFESFEASDRFSFRIGLYFCSIYANVRTEQLLHTYSTKASPQNNAATSILVWG